MRILHDMHIATDGFGKRQHEFNTVLITPVGNNLFSYTATMLDSSQELSKAGGVTSKLISLVKSIHFALT